MTPTQPNPNLDDREPIAEGDYRYYSPSHLGGVPPLVLIAAAVSQDEKMPTAGAGRLPICDYCNNPVASGKHVHERCVERLDAREETADRDTESK